ncbi:MAG: sigma-70 family RNA polymerase sigma factor [Ktedonobacterales bacterium]
MNLGNIFARTPLQSHTTRAPRASSISSSISASISQNASSGFSGDGSGNTEIAGAEEWAGTSLNNSLSDSLLHVARLDGVALPRTESSSEHARTASREEVTLITRARAGDQDAFAMLVRLHQGQVYQLALRMLRDPEDASEATQEAFLAAWQGLRNFREEARFATWLYRITYNHCLKVAEVRKRDRAVQTELAETSARAQQPAQLMSARHAQDAEHEMRELVRHEIANLPPKYRAALMMRHLQELSYEEMAEVMRVPIGTVKTQLFRARALLKERLQDFERDFGRARDEGWARAEEWRSGLEANLRTVFDFAREQTNQQSFDDERGRKAPAGGTAE